MDQHLRLQTSPVARPEAVIAGDRWRITVLADGLVRLEWAPDGTFEDRATTFAQHRAQPVPAFTVADEEEGPLEVVTDRLRLTYDRGPFSPGGLSVQALGNVSSWHSVWRFGEPVEDLGGTARTLDEADGRIPLGPGVVARGGVAVLDDSRSFCFGEDGWVEPRPAGDRVDLYVFAFGHDFDAALRALYAVSGGQPLLPRWALGNWWSRYHRYSAASYLELLDRFDAEGLPFSVAVLDMDWHRVGSVPDRYGSGWTGYTWEPELFPDPEGFLAELHRRGLQVTLNVHPADGVRGFEDAYAAMCEALGRDASTDEPIAFDITRPEFVRAYLEVLHHPLEAQGVDFWWLDWQQGSHSRVPGVDPLWVLNHVHFLDSGREGRRPLTFSRYAGPGSHRYPVGFSGDTVISWASLDFQPEFTATASNIGYGWWSHDVGGHLFGERDDELATRWVQLGAFSPILRLHSSNNPFMVKEPWLYPAEARAAMGEALRLRHRLVPYLHTMNHRAATDGVPLVRPMYHLAPDEPRAYEVPNVFAFGSELVVAPITSPRDRTTLRGAVRAWLPEGTWVDVGTEVVHDGGREVELHRDLHAIPVLLRGGGILPLAADDDLDATRNPERLEVLVAPGADGAFVLLEDDGTGATPEDVPTARTPITWTQATGELVVGPAEDPHGVLPAARTWTVRVLGTDVVHVARDVPPGEAVRVQAGPDPVARTSDLRERLFGVLNDAQWGHAEKLAAWEAITSGAPAATVLAELHAQGVPRSLLGALAELLTARA